MQLVMVLWFLSKNESFINTYYYLLIVIKMKIKELISYGSMLTALAMPFLGGCVSGEYKTVNGVKYEVLATDNQDQSLLQKDGKLYGHVVEGDWEDIFEFKGGRLVRKDYDGDGLEDVAAEMDGQGNAPTTIWLGNGGNLKIHR